MFRISVHRGPISQNPLRLSERTALEPHVLRRTDTLKNYFQATKGASNKQIMRELLKRGLTEAQIAEIEAALARAEQMMGEQLGRIIPPP